MVYKVYGQDNLIAELNSKIEKAPETREKVNMLNELSQELRSSDIEKAKQYAEEALDLSKKLKYNKGSALSFINIAYIHTRKDNFNRAMENYSDAMKYVEKVNDLKEKKLIMTRVFEGLGLINYKSGYLDQAIDSYEKAAKLYLELSYSNNLSKCYHIIGFIYQKAGNKAKANLYFNREAKKTKKTNEDEQNILSTYDEFINN